MKKTIVISAVNIRKGGTLTILRDCLKYLSELSLSGQYRIVALVHKKELALYPAIEYIEIPWTVKSWVLRLWCEYVTMNKVSKRIPNIDLWLSLHDTTPRVKAKRQAVYCQTSFPVLKWKLQDLRFDYKIVIFSLLTQFAYKINANANKYLIVQTEWLKKSFSAIIGLPYSSFVVCPPTKCISSNYKTINREKSSYTFLFASTPDCHKNFELVCKAAEILERELPIQKFTVIFTLSGCENRYSKWLHKKWGHLQCLDFVGFMSREKLYETYAEADCLIFPSRVETWGLPISEFASFGKPMLLADLPYAHETAAGSHATAFFDPYNPQELKDQMKRLITGDTSFLAPVSKIEIQGPVAHSWKELFDLLLNED